MSHKRQVGKIILKWAQQWKENNVYCFVYIAFIHFSFSNKTFLFKIFQAFEEL